MKLKLKVGEVVKLKSGGPLMTVATGARLTKGEDYTFGQFIKEEPLTEDSVYVCCYWFADECLREGFFPVDVLVV